MPDHATQDWRGEVAANLAKQVPALAVLSVLVVAFLYAQDRGVTKLTASVNDLATVIRTIGPCHCE